MQEASAQLEKDRRGSGADAEDIDDDADDADGDGGRNGVDDDDGPGGRESKTAGDGGAEASGKKKKKEAGAKRSYDYLLSMPLWALTLERVEQLKAEQKAASHERDVLTATTAADLWDQDLTAFERGLEEHEARELAELERNGKLKPKRKALAAKKGAGAKRAAATPKKKKAPAKPSTTRVVATAATAANGGKGAAAASVRGKRPSPTAAPATDAKRPRKG